MKGSLTDQIKPLLEELIETYTHYINETLMLIAKTYEMLDQNKEERKEVRQKLKNRLAKESSLRSTDFDLITKKILEWQLNQEKKVKEGIQQFSIMQQDFEGKLKEILWLNEPAAFSGLKDQSEQKIKTIIRLITAFHQEQSDFTQKLKSLLDEAMPLNMTKLKTVMKQIST